MSEQQLEWAHYNERVRPLICDKINLVDDGRGAVYGDAGADLPAARRVANSIVGSGHSLGVTCKWPGERGTVRRYAKNKLGLTR